MSRQVWPNVCIHEESVTQQAECLDACWVTALHVLLGKPIHPRGAWPPACVLWPVGKASCGRQCQEIPAARSAGQGQSSVGFPYGKFMWLKFPRQFTNLGNLSAAWAWGSWKTSLWGVLIQFDIKLVGSDVGIRRLFLSGYWDLRFCFRVIFKNEKNWKGRLINLFLVMSCLETSLWTFRCS